MNCYSAEAKQQRQSQRPAVGRFGASPNSRSFALDCLQMAEDVSTLQTMFEDYWVGKVRTDQNNVEVLNASLLVTKIISGWVAEASAAADEVLAAPRGDEPGARRHDQL